MEASKKIRGNPSPREGLLEKLERFQQAGEAILPQHTREQRKENLEALRGAAKELREYLALHLAPKELSEWRELPDSNLEIAAFGYELKMEHADLQRELGDLVREIEEYEKVLDREEAALDGWLRQRVDESLADPVPAAPAREVFARLRRHHARRSKNGPPKTGRDEEI